MVNMRLNILTNSRISILTKIELGLDRLVPRTFTDIVEKSKVTYSLDSSDDGYYNELENSSDSENIYNDIDRESDSEISEESESDISEESDSDNGEINSDYDGQTNENGLKTIYFRSVSKFINTMEYSKSNNLILEGNMSSLVYDFLLEYIENRLNKSTFISVLKTLSQYNIKDKNQISQTIPLSVETVLKQFEKSCSIGVDFKPSHKKVELIDKSGKLCKVEIEFVDPIKIFGLYLESDLVNFSYFFDGYVADSYPTHGLYGLFEANVSGTIERLFDPDNSGQQVESIKVEIEPDNDEFVEPLHLAKVNQFENLHSITIPINSYQILSNLSEDMGFIRLYNSKSDTGNSENMKSELNQMINSIITSKSLMNLNVSSVNSTNSPIDYEGHYNGNRDGGDYKTFANKINETIESFSNSFQPLFSELNTSIERIEFDCVGLLNINTFSNLLNKKSIKYLYLYGSDFIVYSSKPIDNGRGSGSSELHLEPISINQYLFENIFTSPLTSIRHYKIRFKELNHIKFIFNLILNNIFKLQLYSLIFKIYENELVCEFVKEYKNLINNISIQQQQQQQQKSNNITLKEIKIETNDNEYIQGINNINNPYFITNELNTGVNHFITITKFKELNQLKFNVDRNEKAGLYWLYKHPQTLDIKRDKF
ncbi:hypothetical protein ACTFIW_011062 [Dictyostelium discoideum]